jgi:hypothetical protein
LKLVATERSIQPHNKVCLSCLGLMPELRCIVDDRSNQRAIYFNINVQLITRLIVDRRCGDDVKQKGSSVHDRSCQYRSV